MRNPSTTEEIEYMQDNFCKVSQREIAAHLNRSQGFISNQMKKLGLIPPEKDKPAPVKGKRLARGAKHKPKQKERIFETRMQEGLLKYRVDHKTVFELRPGSDINKVVDRYNRRSEL
jgi:hypothetical protein